MKNFYFVLLIVGAFAQNIWGQNALPVVKTDSLAALPLYLEYEILDAEDSDSFYVQIYLSSDDGLSFENISMSLPSQDGVGMIAKKDKYGLLLEGSDFGPGMILRIEVDDLYEFSIEEVVASVSEDSLMHFMNQVEGIRHRTGGAAHLAQVKTTLYNHYLQNGCDTIRHNFNFIPSYTGENIFGIKAGADGRKERYFVGGHYDTVNDSPGADDNGTAVVGAMEIARVFKDFSFEKELRYVNWDLEEDGLQGSTAFINDQAAELENKGYLNLEMIGYYDESVNSQSLPTGFDVLFPDVYAAVEADSFRGNFITNVGNGMGSKEIMEDFEMIATEYVPELKVLNVESPGNGTLVLDLLRSDHAPFWFQNMPAVMLTDGAEFRNPYYHSPEDTSDKLNFEFMRQTVQASVAYLAEKAEIGHKGWIDLRWDDLLGNTDGVSKISLEVTPSVVNESLFLDGDWNDTEYQYQIIDVQGQVHAEGSITKDSHEINVHQLSSAVYFIRIYDSVSNLSSTLKFVKI